MANETILPIRDIPGTGTPSASSMVALDSGVAMFPAELSDLADAVRPMASEAEAEAGVDAVKGMSPLTVKQSIASEVGDTLASASQGALADTAVQPARSISAGAGLTGGGDLSADRSLALNAASIASLAKADSAVQPDTTITAGTGLTGGGDLSADRTISLNSTSIASLAKADAAVLYTAQTLTAPQQALVRAQIGLGNVDNTADASKPISTATQSALNAKADSARTITAGTGLTGGGDLTANRSIGLSASSVASLGRADTAVQATGTSAQYIRGDGVFAAFPPIPAGTVTSVAATVPTGLSIAGSPITSSGTLAISYASGYVGYTTAEQTKLSGIAAGAQVNTVTSVAGKTGAVTLVKADVGLANVDNTSDANKPVSTATQTALNAKANTTTTISAGSGLDGGGSLAANRSLALSSASIASLAKADSAVQLGANGAMPSGGATGQILAKASGTAYDVGWISSEAATAVSYGPQTLTGPQKTQALTNLGGTAVGRAVFEAADPAAAQTAIGVSAFMRSMLDDADAAAVWATLGGAQTAGKPGYLKLPNGFIFQWGTLASGGATDVGISFPTAFPNAAWAAFATPILGTSAASTVLPAVDLLTTSGVAIRRWTINSSGVSSWNGFSVNWYAIGN